MNHSDNEKNRQAPRKWKHLDNFTLQNEREYVYRGEYMVCSVSAAEYRRNCMSMLLASALASALLVVAGCFSDTGMEGNAFLLIPYALSLIEGLLLCWSLVSMLRYGPRLRKYQYEKTVYAAKRKMTGALLGTAAGSLSWILSCLHGSGSVKGTGSVILRLSFMAGFACFLVSLILDRKLSWKKE